MNLILGQPCGKWRIPLQWRTLIVRPLLCPSNAPARSRAYPTESHLLESRSGWLCDNQTIPVRGRVACLHAPWTWSGLCTSSALRVTMGVLDDISWGVALTKWGFFNAINTRGPRGSAVAAVLGGTLAGWGAASHAGMLTPACRVGLPCARLLRATPLNGWLWGEGVLLLCEPMLCTP